MGHMIIIVSAPSATVCYVVFVLCAAKFIYSSAVFCSFRIYQILDKGMRLVTVIKHKKVDGKAMKKIKVEIKS